MTSKPPPASVPVERQGLRVITGGKGWKRGKRTRPKPEPGCALRRCRLVQASDEDESSFASHRPPKREGRRDSPS